MPSMDIGVEVCMGDEAAGEIVLSVDFEYRAGSPAHFGSLAYPGHPADPAEVEIETVFWPYQRWVPETKSYVADHIEMPWAGLPQAVAEAIEEHICAHYQPEDDWPEPY